MRTGEDEIGAQKEYKKEKKKKEERKKKVDTEYVLRNVQKSWSILNCLPGGHEHDETSRLSRFSLANF